MEDEQACFPALPASFALAKLAVLSPLRLPFSFSSMQNKPLKFHRWKNTSCISVFDGSINTYSGGSMACICFRSRFWLFWLSPYGLSFSYPPQCTLLSLIYSFLSLRQYIFCCVQVVLSSLGLSTQGLVIATAVQNYGMYIGDRGGSGMNIFKNVFFILFFRRITYYIFM
jgi:hypothetical protein